MPRPPTSNPFTTSRAFRLLPALLLTAMLAIAVILELTVLEPAAGVVELWLPKLPLAVILVLPWLPYVRRHTRDTRDRS